MTGTLRVYKEPTSDRLYRRGGRPDLGPDRVEIEHVSRRVPEKRVQFRGAAPVYVRLDPYADYLTLPPWRVGLR